MTSYPVSPKSKLILHILTQIPRQVLLQTDGKRDWAGEEKTDPLLSLQKAAEEALCGNWPWAQMFPPETGKQSDSIYSSDIQKNVISFGSQMQSKDPGRGSLPAQTRSPLGTASAASGLASSLQDLLTLASFTLLDLLGFEQ